MKDIINAIEKSNTWKIHLAVVINFIFSKVIGEEPSRNSKSGNIEIMIYDKTDEIINKSFESLLSKYQTC